MALDTHRCRAGRVGLGNHLRRGMGAIAMTNILPMVSAASYCAARDAALRAAPRLENRGLIEEAMSLRRRAAKYDELAAETMKTRARQDEFERRMRVFDARRK